MSVYGILYYLSTFIDKYDSINYDFSNFTTKWENQKF